MSRGAAVPTPARACPTPHQLSFPRSAKCLCSPAATLTPGDKPPQRSCWSWRHRSSTAPALVCGPQEISLCRAKWWPERHMHVLMHRICDYDPIWEKSLWI